MDWKGIKTIFIITFLVLDIFLLQQLLDERKDNELKQFVNESSEEKLDSIEYEVKIPVIEEKLSLISTKNINLNKDDYKEFEDKVTVETTAGTSTYVTLKEPFLISFSSEEEVRNQIEFFLQNFVLFGNEYRIWEISQDRQLITLHQTYNQSPIYFDNSKFDTNPNGVIELELDEDGNILRYKQSYLLISQQGNEQSILSVEEAMVNLFRNGFVNLNSTVHHIELCYYSLISIENTQVFSPTWHIQVDEENYMINAVDGTITQFDEETE